MIKTLINNWWLLALRGVLAAVFSAAAFLMQSSAETFTLHQFAMKGTMVFLGMLALAAGICTIAAAVWRSANGKWRLLLLDGSAVSAAGLVLMFSNTISFRVATYVLVVLAITIGGIELATARTLRRHVPDEWLLGLAGVASMGFALAFLVMGTQQAGPVFIWLGCYSGFSAVCMLGLAFRLRNLQASIHRMAHHPSAHG